MGPAPYYSCSTLGSLLCIFFTQPLLLLHHFLPLLLLCSILLSPTFIHLLVCQWCSSAPFLPKFSVLYCPLCLSCPSSLSLYHFHSFFVLLLLSALVLFVLLSELPVFYLQFSSFTLWADILVLLGETASLSKPIPLQKYGTQKLSW